MAIPASCFRFPSRASSSGCSVRQILHKQNLHIPSLPLMSLTTPRMCRRPTLTMPAARSPLQTSAVLASGGHAMRDESPLGRSTRRIRTILSSGRQHLVLFRAAPSPGFRTRPASGCGAKLSL